MSVYRPKRKDGSYKSEFWHYDFQLKPEGASKSVRFHGSTGQTTKAAAKAVEKRIRELAATGKLTSGITVGEACWRYWEEVGARLKSSDDEARHLENISRLLDSSTLLTDLNPEKIATAVRRRAAEPIMRLKKVGSRKKPVLRPTDQIVSNATVNRTFTEPLRRLLRRARRTWSVPVDLEGIDWGDLLLREPEGRARALQEEEEARYWEALRPDYHAIVEMYLISGRRKMDWVDLQKFKVDRSSRTVRMPSRKKNKPGHVTLRLTDREFQIIAAEMTKSNHEAVFTYIVQRGKEKGLRRPITKSGLRRAHTTALKHAGIEDFRVHDLRHTFGTRILRLTKNLKLAQQALEHSDISSTLRYAHVLDEEVTDARQGLAESRNSPGAPRLRFERQGKK